jgi:hypothetical protein
MSISRAVPLEYLMYLDSFLNGLNLQKSLEPALQFMCP